MNNITINERRRRKREEKASRNEKGMLEKERKEGGRNLNHLFYLKRIYFII